MALTTGAIFVRPVNPLPSGQVQFFLPSDPDQHYLIQASTNLVDWISLTNLTASSSFMDLVDADGGLYPHRFYRSALYAVIEGGRLSDFSRTPDGEVAFYLEGLEGRSYVIQVSANLMNWEDLRSVMASNGKLLFSDGQAAVHPTRFYRLRSE